MHFFASFSSSVSAQRYVIVLFPISIVDYICSKEPCNMRSARSSGSSKGKCVANLQNALRALINTVQSGWQMVAMVAQKRASHFAKPTQIRAHLVVALLFFIVHIAFCGAATFGRAGWFILESLCTYCTEG